MRNIIHLETKKKTAGESILLFLIVLLVAFVFLFPIYMAVINSFKTTGEVLTSALTWPSRLLFDNYQLVISVSNYPLAFVNSLLITGGTMCLNILVSASAGYSLARWHSKLANLLTFVFLSSMFVPFHAIMIALLKIAKGLHLTGSIGGLVLIYVGLQCPIPIFLVKGFVGQLPPDMEAAARIDGASILKSYFYIVLPLLKPILSTIAVLNVLWTWNDFLLPYIILAKPITIPLSQMYFYGQYNQKWNLIMAGFVLATIPVMVFFLIMQKHIIAGIANGAVKG